MAVAPDPRGRLADYARDVYPTLQSRSYYQLLGVPKTAELPVIRNAYYAAASALHPDRYHQVDDAVMKDKLETIYARVTEAYRILMSPDKRAEYDRGLAAGKLRWDRTAREAPSSRNPEDTIKHPQAKKFFRMGMLCLGKQDWQGAVMNFNFATAYEPGVPVIAEKRREAQAGAAAKAGATSAKKP